MNCLVVDDMGPMRRTVSLTLRELGFENIAEAKNGREAFDKIKTNLDVPGKKIELAIVDWNMAPLTGLDLLKMVRKEKTMQDIIFIMITAEQLQDNVIAAIQAGVDDYIVKPFTPKTVKAKFANLTQRKLAEMRKEIDASFDEAPPEADMDRWRAEKLDHFKRRLLKLLEFCSWSHIVPLELGRAHFRFGEYGEAEKWLRKTIAMNFGASEAHHLLSQVLRKLGKTPESIEALEIAVVERPSSGALKQKLGEAHLRAGNADKALELLTESIKLFDEQNDRRNMAMSRNARGEALLAKGEDEKAMADIKDAVSLNPDMLAAHYNLMVALKSMGKVDEAREALKRIEAIQPSDADGWVSLGKAYLAQSEPAKARFAFNKAGELANGNFKVFEEVCLAYYRHKMADDTLDWLDKAEAANPSDPFTYNLKGIIYRARENYEAAIEQYEKGLAIEPENAGIYFNLGVAHYRSGGPEKAAGYFRKAKELDPASTEADEYLNKLSAQT